MNIVSTNLSGIPSSVAKCVYDSRGLQNEEKNKIWKRAGAVILSTLFFFGTLPTGVMAEETVGQDTNEEELLSEEVVSEDEPAEEILPEEVSSEEDAAEMDYDILQKGIRSQ